MRNKISFYGTFLFAFFCLQGLADPITPQRGEAIAHPPCSFLFRSVNSLPEIRRGENINHTNSVVFREGSELIQYSFLDELADSAAARNPRQTNRDAVERLTNAGVALVPNGDSFLHLLDRSRERRIESLQIATTGNHRLNRIARLFHEMFGTTTYFAAEMLSEGSAAYNPIQNRLYLPGSAVRNLNAINSSILHEMIHAITRRHFIRGENGFLQGYVRPLNSSVPMEFGGVRDIEGYRELFTFDELASYATDIQFAASPDYNKAHGIFQRTRQVTQEILSHWNALEFSFSTEPPSFLNVKTERPYIFATVIYRPGNAVFRIPLNDPSLIADYHAITNNPAGNSEARNRLIRAARARFESLDSLSAHGSRVLAEVIRLRNLDRTTGQSANVATIEREISALRRLAARSLSTASFVAPENP